MLNQAQEIEVSIDQPSHRRMSILVVDDSEVDRKRLLRLCDEAGLKYVATEVASLSEMRDAMDAKLFDLVFIDYVLVDEDGLGAVDMLANDRNQTAASIMIAGEGRLDVAVEAMRRGCSDYLLKSAISVEALQKSVANALERRIMTLTLQRERDRRIKLERAVRRYANACSVEMRTILSGTLRRVRKLRSNKLSGETARQLGDLEASIDQLWNALPSFSDLSPEAIAQAKPPPFITYLPDTRG